MLKFILITSRIITFWAIVVSGFVTSHELSDGSLDAFGTLSSNNNLSVLGSFHLHGRLQLSPTRISGGTVVIIDDIATKTLLEITDDGIATGTNIAVVNGTPKEGQLLLIKNSDSDILTGFGNVHIQPWSMTLLVFLPPQGWQEVIGSSPNSGAEVKEEKANKQSNSWFGSIIGYQSKNADDNFGLNEMLHMEGDTTEFSGDSIDFGGASVINAALVNATFENVRHLTVESIGVASLASPNGNRGGADRLVTVDSRGKLTSVEHIRWEESSKELKVSALSSFGQTDMEVRSNVDFTNHRIKNFDVEPGTELENLVLKGGIIEDSIFRNVSAEGLRLGDVHMETASLRDLSHYASQGVFLTVEKGGRVTVSDAFHQIDDALLSVDKDVRFTGVVDMNNNSMVNVRIKSGIIEGDKMSIHVQSVSTSSLTLLPAANADNKLIGNGRLAMIDENGSIKRSSIDLMEGTAIGDVKVCGTLDFVKDPSSSGDIRGSIKNAKIRGGSIHGIQALEVAGESSLNGDVDIIGDLFVSGAITVSGTVFGAGPYVDVSDVRLKRDIKELENGVDLLQKLQMIKGVSYVLQKDSSPHDTEKREIGFIAQEVEKVFPLLVYTDPNDGLKGVQYSRFVPVLVDAVNELTQELMSMKQNFDKVLSDNKMMASTLSNMVGE